jgi:carboxymethylproline synthase
MEHVKVQDVDRVRVITWVHEKDTNPVGRTIAAAVVVALAAAETDEDVDAIVLTGGPGRSFSAGGDFAEVQLVEGDEAVDSLIDWVTDLYLAVLHVQKPLVAAIDNYAVGLGFQISMMCDWRIMTTNGSFMMPELKHGIGASVGAAILSVTSGLNVARRVIMSCESIPAAAALADQLIDELVEPEDLMARAVQRAARLGRYPRAAFTGSKQALTRPLADALEETRRSSKTVHRKAFEAKAMHKHFATILHQDRAVASVSDRDE